MLHHLAGDTLQIANLVYYNCQPLEGGNKSQISCNDISGAYLNFDFLISQSKPMVWNLKKNLINILFEWPKHEKKYAKMKAKKIPLA